MGNQRTDREGSRKLRIAFTAFCGIVVVLLALAITYAIDATDAMTWVRKHVIFRVF
jgi:hypothetical protein